MDPRTRMILFKLLNQSIIHEIFGCVSTGKEANVYYATSHYSYSARTPNHSTSLIAPSTKSTPSRPHSDASRPHSDTSQDPITADSVQPALIEKTIFKYPEHIAIKIYKTSILTFKDRDRYVTGEFRFRNGYSKNPRKMVQVWAEKEVRNLKRMRSAGIPCPEPLLLRNNVLLMEFLGNKQGWAAPKLKDAFLSAEKIPQLYLQMIKMMRTMYLACRLVHADLSEYNLLFVQLPPPRLLLIFSYHKGQIFVIDVSQSVEHDHPNAFEFLRKDCQNIHDFFACKGARVLSMRALFEFIINQELSIEGVGACSEDAFIALMQDKNQHSPGDSIEAAVFKEMYIPRTLQEFVVDGKCLSGASIGDFVVLEEGRAAGRTAVVRKQLNEDECKGDCEENQDELDGAIETTFENSQRTHCQKNIEEISASPDISLDCEVTDGESFSSSDSSISDSECDATASKKVFPRHNADGFQELKRQVKEAQREKRKTKIPKAVKKRKEKIGRVKAHK